MSTFGNKSEIIPKNKGISLEVNFGRFTSFKALNANKCSSLS